MFSTSKLIKGDKVDQVGKNVLIIVISALSVAAGIIATGDTKDYKEMVLIVALNLEIASITAAGKRVNKKWRFIPMIHFAIYGSAELVRHVCLNGLQSIHLSSVIIATVAMIASYLLMNPRNPKDNEEEEFTSIQVRLCMLIMLLMKLYETMAGIVSLSGGLELFADFISRGLFFLAIVIMSLPEQGLLNIRRICSTVSNTSMACFLIFGTVLVLAQGLEGGKMLNLIVVFFSVFTVTTILLCCIDGKESPDIENEYEYDLGERILKGIGWCISKEEDANRVQYLRDAFNRDFLTEYSRRIYNNKQYAEDISSIQLRLKVIKGQLKMLGKNENAENQVRTKGLKDEGVDLLGKLCIKYHFDTGINSCSIELLKTGARNGAEREEKETNYDKK